MKLLSEGAEAGVYLDGKNVIKKRRRKGYRIKQLDEKLRKFRTKREARILDKLKEAGIAVPEVKNVSEKSATIEMEFAEGKKVRDILGSGNCTSIGKMMGKAIAAMHDAGIIHGDLTTSNMVKGKKLYFIDFGLGFFSDKAEDKAVDLHLLKQALNSSHNKIAMKCFAAVIKAYERSYSSSEILKRLEKVEARGRYKGKAN